MDIDLLKMELEYAMNDLESASADLSVGFEWGTSMISARKDICDAKDKIRELFRQLENWRRNDPPA